MRILALGEMMVELSGAGPGLWRQGFAGDTFNTAWYLAALRPDWQISYGTRLGQDPLSDAALDTLTAARISTAWVTRDPLRSMGLYMIALQNGERSFSYWRGQSAARLLAEDDNWLHRACNAHDMIYLSGVTLAILDTAGRNRLLDALAGRRVLFDPNIRARLWEDVATMRATLTKAAALAEICLPSFDDEAAAFGDTTPEATARRYAAAGAGEVVVKNGANRLVIWADGAEYLCPAPPAVTALDTTGAGDSFNAGYIAARWGGSGPKDAVRYGQDLAAMVIGHPGALVPPETLAEFLCRTKGDIA